MQVLGEKAEELAKENEGLRQSQLEDKGGNSRRKGGEEEKLMAGQELDVSDRIADLHEISDIMKAENNVLAEQANLVRSRRRCRSRFISREMNPLIYSVVNQQQMDRPRGSWKKHLRIWKKKIDNPNI